MPAFIDNWWKTRQARRQEASIKASKKGIGAALKALKNGTLSLTPGQALSARMAGGFLLFLIVAFIIYAFFEQRKRNREVVVDTSRHNLSLDRVVTYIPKERYLLDIARIAGEDALRKAHLERSAPPAPLLTPYEYPPAYTNHRQRR